MFTNFTQDHLDYHGTMEAYWQAKAALFDWPGLQAAVVNLDDPGAELARTAAAGVHRPVWTVSCGRSRPGSPGAPPIRYRWRPALCRAGRRAHLPAHPADRPVQRVQPAGRGRDARAGVPAGRCGGGLRQLLVPGRMERMALAGQPLVVVDYAHTPGCAGQGAAGRGRWRPPLAAGLWCVFGCGGDRDARASAR